MQKETKTEEQKFKTSDQLVNENKHLIDEWKEEHKTVKQLDAKSKYHGKVGFIIGKPTHPMLEAIQKYENDGKPHKVTELLQKSCIKAGPPNYVQLFKEDVDLKHSVMGAIGELLERLEVETKEL